MMALQYLWLRKALQYSKHIPGGINNGAEYQVDATRTDDQGSNDSSSIGNVLRWDDLCTAIIVYLIIQTDTCTNGGPTA